MIFHLACSLLQNNVVSQNEQSFTVQGLSVYLTSLVLSFLLKYIYFSLEQ